MLRRFLALGKDSLIYGFGRTASQAIAFLLVPIYTRYLDQSQYGSVELIESVAWIAYIFFLAGMDNAVFRFYFDSEDQDERKRVVSTIFFYMVVSPFLQLILLFFLAAPLADWLLDQEQSRWILQIAFLGAYVDGLLIIPFQLLRARNKPATFSIFTFARLLSQTLCSILFVTVMGWGVGGVFLGKLIPSIALLFFLVPTVGRLIGRAFSLTKLKEILRFSLPSIPAALFLYVIRLSDRFFLKGYTGLDQVGLYTVANKLSLVPWAVVTAFTTAWPFFNYQYYGKSEHKQMVALAYTYFFLLTTTAALGLSLFIRPIMRIMTTPQFYEAEWAVIVLAFAQLGMGSYFQFSVGINVTKNRQYLPVMIGLAALVNLALNFVLIPAYGVMGAAWASLITYTIQALLVNWLSARYYPIDYEYTRLAKVLALALALLGIDIAAKLLWTPPLATQIGLEIVLFLAFPIGLWILRFPTDSELAAMRALFHHAATAIKQGEVISTLRRLLNL